MGLNIKKFEPNQFHFYGLILINFVILLYIFLWVHIFGLIFLA